MCTGFVVVLWSHALQDSLAVERSFFFLFNYCTAWSSQRPLCQSAASSHNGAAQQRTMNQIPDRSPQVQRPGWQIKTAELQWLSYSTPSSFPSGHPCGDTGLCVCLLHGGKCSHWEHREGLKDGGGRLFVSFCWGRKTACSFTNVIKPLRTKSWQPKAALKSIMDLNWPVFFTWDKDVNLFQKSCLLLFNVVHHKYRVLGSYVL